MEEVKYIILDIEHLSKVMWNDVLDNGPSTVQYSCDGKKFILKYIGEQPEFVFFIAQDTVGLWEYTSNEIEEITSASSEWTGSTSNTKLP